MDKKSIVYKVRVQTSNDIALLFIYEDFILFFFCIDFMKHFSL